MSADLAGYRVVAEDDTIGARKSTPVRAIAVDSVDGEVPVDSTTLLTYRLLPDTVGMFINAIGDTISSPLTNVPYADARAGRIRFLAADSLGDGTQAIVEVVQVSDTTKRGRDTVWIAEIVRVVITRPDSTNVYPTYVKHNNLTTKRNWIDLELKVLSSDSLPVPNYWVKVTSPALVDSGGHSHDGNRPMGRFNHPLTSTDTLHTTDTLMVRTDATGKAKFRYVASQFGGVEQITAKLMSDTTRFDTLSLITRVPGLEDFSLIQSNFWDNVGNTGTTDACNPGHFVPIGHYSNHWVTHAMVESLQLALWDFYEWSGSEDGGGQYIVLKINDMSLEKGGSFDIRGDWNMIGCHSLHRVGLSLDINNSGLKKPDPNHPGKKIWTEPRGRKLNSFMNNHKLYMVEEGPIHFELRRR